MQKGLAGNVLLIGIIILAVLAGGFLIIKNPWGPIYIGPLPAVSPPGKACTLEAKVCPDGSSVGRTGPNCEFAVCPSGSGYTNKPNSSPNPKVCQTNTDCSLLICSGCFNKDWIKTAPPENACLQYQGFNCQCINNSCTIVK